MYKVRQLKDDEYTSAKRIAERPRKQTDYGLACYILGSDICKETSYGIFEGSHLIGYVIGAVREDSIIILQCITPDRETAYRVLDELVKKANKLGKKCVIQLSESDREQYKFYRDYCERKAMALREFRSSEVIGFPEYVMVKD